MKFNSKQMKSKLLQSAFIESTQEYISLEVIFYIFF